MKSIITFFYMCMVVSLPFQLNAQISTAKAYKYSLWTVVKTMNCKFMPPGTTGSAQTWDFTGLTPLVANETMRVQYVNRTSNMPFPNASMVEKDGKDYTFFEYTSNGVYEIGELDSTANPPDTTVYTDTRYIMKHPNTYNNIYMDTFRLQNGADTAMGVLTDTVESFGVLKLPNGTFENTIRMRISEEITGTFSGIPFTAKNISYQWFDISHSTPLLRIDSMEVGSSKSHETVYLLSEDPTVITDVPVTPLHINAMFSGNDIILTGGTEKGHMYNLSLFTITGQRLYQTAFSGGGPQHFSMNSSIPAGIYILGVDQQDKEGAIGTVKLVKQ